MVQTNSWIKVFRRAIKVSVETDRKGGKYRIVNCYPNKDPKKSIVKTITTSYQLN